MFGLTSGANLKIFILWALLTCLAVLTMTDPLRGLFIAASALVIFLCISGIDKLHLI